MDTHQVATRPAAGVRARRFGAGATWVERIRRRRRAAYGAGLRLDDALAACRDLATCGLASTIGYAAPPDASARAVADTQLAAFRRLSAGDLDCYVSVKLSTLGFDAGLFAELATAAAESGRRLHVDALAPDTADATWRLLEGAANGGRLGATLPGRWRRSVGDAARARDLGLPVRVVKGQWADGSADAAGGFLDVVDRLRGYAARVAVATHDVALLSESLRRLRGTPCEVELLHGLPFRAPARVATEHGVPIRVYVPYGATGAPYDLATLRRNPAAAWWLAQDVLLGKEKLWRAVRR